MSIEPIPEAKEDDPEEVSDKLSIAAAMWARGEKNDALSWLRRAAQSASDAEADMRALELAKAASTLAELIGSGAPPPSVRTEAAKPAPPKTSPPPNKPPPKPLRTAPPGGKLPPLPPLRPLGTANAPPPRSRPPEARKPSQPRMPAAAPTPPSAPPAPAQAAAPQMNFEDDEETRQIPVSPALLRQSSEQHAAVVPSEGEQTPEAPPSQEHDETDLRATMRREADSEGVTEEKDTPPASARAQAGSEPSSGDRPTHDPGAAPLAIGLRVRLRIDGDAVTVVPDDDESLPEAAGIPAILVPSRRDDDLRTLFYRMRR